MIISDVLTRWPQTTAVFHDHNMACIGCVLAPFYTVKDAAEVYGLSLEEFLAELGQAIQSGHSPAAEENPAER